MRRVIWIGCFIFLAVLGGFFKLALQTAQSRTNGSGLNTSNCAGCHSGATSGSGTITGIPATYVPGTAYPITVSISGGPAARWGFRLTATGGTFAAGSGSQTPSSTVITHTVAGTNQNSWSFNWTAPAATLGSVGFAGGALSANNDGGTDGDSPLTLPAANSQPGATCSYSLSAASQNFTSSAGTGSVNVTSGTGCSWTATSNDPFITITSGGSATGNGTVNYSVAANPTTSARNGTLTVAGQTYSVSQAAGTVTCAYTLSASSQSFSSTAGTGTVNVTTTAGCSWTATSNNPFITITSGGSTSGNGTVNYSLAANNTAAARTGTLTIAGQSFTLTQAATTSSTFAETRLVPSSQEQGSASFLLHVYGNNLLPNALVLWNGVPKVTLFLDATEVLAIIPSRDLSAPGEIPVSVKEGETTSNSLPFTITSESMPSQPQLEAVMPRMGSVVGNTKVVLLGRGFAPHHSADANDQPASGESSSASQSGSNSETPENNRIQVLFDGIPLTHVSILNSRMLEGVTPPHVAGPVDVVVVFADEQRATLPSGYTYVDTEPVPPVNPNTNLMRWTIPYLVDSNDFRTNLGINNLGSTAAIVTISLVDSQGQVISKTTTAVPARGMKQIDNVVRLLQNSSEMTGWEGYLLLESTSNIRAWASQIDNLTNDPSLELAKRSGSPHVLIPSSVSNSRYLTSLMIVNTSTSSGQITISSHDNGGIPQGAALTVSIPASGYLYYEDFYKSLGVSNVSGPIFIDGSNAGLSLLSTARVYTPEDHTSGYLDGINSDLAATRVYLPYTVDTEDFRTNMGIVNPASHPANVLVNLVDRNGVKLGTLPVTVPAGGMVQINNVNRQIIGTAVTSHLQGYLRLDSTQPIIAWSSQIDNLSQDPSLAIGSSTGSSHLLIPSTTNRGSFKSTLVVVNLDSASTNVEITFRDSGGSLAGTVTATIPGGGFISYSDILTQLGVINNFGPLEITSLDGKMLIAISRVYSTIHTGGYFEGMN